MSEIGWHHAVESGGSWDGFNDSGIYTFKGKPIESLGREIAQNSRDEVLDPSKPVRIEFEYFDLQSRDIPDIDELKDNFEICRTSTEDKRAKTFFEAAKLIIEKSTIPVLKISDFNTNGIKGPCEPNKPYHAFMKASGESVKSNAISGGSFGIGKNAPYAVSELRTIFVSTAFRAENGSIQEYVQAKSILMSHIKNGEVRRGQGYWGVKDQCLPVENSKLIPGWLKRPVSPDTNVPELGTSIYVLGFSKPSNWEERLTASIISNFFGAITNGQLEVEING